MSADPFHRLCQLRCARPHPKEFHHAPLSRERRAFRLEMEREHGVGTLHIRVSVRFGGIDVP